MRKEANNTFVDGLIQDLNPIDTPNTVLTDNVNGTIITYNGNEFSLQNDGGNYPLTHCKLKPNYIPVGIKEYADTLYIVSYNPIDKTTEIGSYPSPMEINSSNDSEDTVTIESVIKQSVTSPNYTDLIQKSKLYTFSDEKFKIYPGDEYKINVQDESKYIYESLEYYIIDENRNKYNITEHIKNNSDFVPIGWTVPGWMAVQYRLAVFEDFQMNTRSFTAPALANRSDGIINLNFQLKISDALLLNRLPNGHLDEIGLSIKIINDKQNTEIYTSDLLFTDIDGKFIEWYEASKILWAQKEITLSDLSQGDKLTIIATPFIQITVDDVVHKIVYDNFTEHLNISLTNIGSFSDFRIADNIWKFWIEDDDKQKLYLEFDISGPSITNGKIDLYYKINKLTESNSTYTKLDYYTGIGQNMISIPFNDNFLPEDIYIIEFVFSEKHPSEINIESDIENKYHYSVKKLIIASQIFSKFVREYNHFDNITFDDWSSAQEDSIKNEQEWNIDVISNNNVVKSYEKGIISENGLINSDIPEELGNFWKTSFITDKYNHTAFIKENDWYDVEGEVTEFLRGYYTNADVKIKTEMSMLTGGLWNGLKRNTIMRVKSYDELLSASSYSIDTLQKQFELSVQPIVASKCDVHYEKITSGLVRGSASRTNIISEINKGDGVKYGILTGSNRKSGTNWYVSVGFGGVNADLSTDPNKYIPAVNDVGESGSKTSIPNSLSKEIVSFMLRYNLPYFVMFVATKPVNGDKSIGLKKGSELLFNSAGDSVYMQPFMVFRNKQNNPIFFSIDGYDPYYFMNSDYDNGGHGIQFKEWPFLHEFVTHMNEIFSKFIKYDITNITDGFFIKAVPSYDTTYSELDLNVEIDISDATEWFVQNYNILNIDDRQNISKLLLTKNVTFGKLLSGLTSKINGKTINAVNYKKKFSINSNVKASLEDLALLIDRTSYASKTQWDEWRTDDLYQDANSPSLSGMTTVGNTALSEKFKKSEMFKLIQQSDSGSSMTLSTSGDHLSFEVVKGGGGSIGQDASWHIGLIHPTITFP